MAQGEEGGKGGWWQKPVAIIAGLTALVGAVAGLLQALDSPAMSRLVLRLLGDEPEVAADPDAVGDPHWIADSRTGCEVYNPGPLPNEAIEWSGPCVDGRAHGNGVLTWFLNGEATGLRYQGEYKSGMRDGFGVETMYEGSLEQSYAGEFKANSRHGHGILRWTSGESWEGPFVDGLANGWGRFTAADGSASEKQFVNGNLTAVRP